MGFVKWLAIKRKKHKQADPDHVPVHVAIIMDGNGRWARRRGLTRSAGHREGVRNLERMARYCAGLGIQYLTVYAFSTENWKRPPQEVDTLIDLMREYVANARERFARDRIRLKIIGDLSRAPKDLQDKIRQCELDTAEFNRMTLVIAWDYGGRDEIVNAARLLAEKAAAGELNAGDITGEVLEEHMYTRGIPDPDLMIRTSGEQRISNFLLWQTAYTELYFTPVLWPDFHEEQMREALVAYRLRDRRYGGTGL